MFTFRISQEFILSKGLRASERKTYNVKNKRAWERPKLKLKTTPKGIPTHKPATLALASNLAKKLSLESQKGNIFFAFVT